MRQVESLAFDQTGCRMIQRKLEETIDACADGFVAALIQRMRPFLATVMMNQFGNYLCQKIIEVASDDDLRCFFRAIVDRTFDIASNVHGTRAIQTLLEVLGQKNDRFDAEILELVHKLEEHAVELTMHTHGNHVIQSILMTFKASN